MNQADTAGTPGPTLTEVAHREVNQLFDALALLDAIAERVDDLNLPKSASDELKERQHSTLRLVQMTSAKLKGVVEAFDAHI